MSYTMTAGISLAALATLFSRGEASVLQQRPLGWSGELQLSQIPETRAREAAASRAQDLLWHDQADVEELLSQPQPAPAAARYPPVVHRRGNRARLDSLLQRHVARVPSSPLLETHELEPLQFTAADKAHAPQHRGALVAGLLQMPRRGAFDEGMVAVEARFCDPPCDAERGICAIRSRFAWSGGGSPTCVCSDPTDPRACHTGASSSGPLGLMQEVVASRVPTEVPFFGLLRELNTVWMTAAAATVGVFLLAMCWLRRPSAKAAVPGTAEEWQAASLEAPLSSREEWMRMTARRPAPKSKLARVPQVVKDDSDEGETTADR